MSSETYEKFKQKIEPNYDDNKDETEEYILWLQKTEECKVGVTVTRKLVPFVLAVYLAVNRRVRLNL